MARFEGGNKGTIWVALNSIFTRKFATVAELFLDREMTYVPAQDGTLSAGDIVEAQGFRYQVAASTATDHHVTTAGGVKLYVLPMGNVVYLDAFAPAKDDATSDRDKIMSAISVTPEGGTLIFSKGVYRISQKFTVNKRINIDFGGATIKINNSSAPNNMIFDAFSLTDAAVSWTESVLEGADTFTVAPTGLSAGDFIMLELGVGADPYDPNEEHYVRLCKVLAVTGSSLTVDIQVPYDIAGSSNRFRKITSLVSDCWFKNLVIDYVDGTTPDTFIYPHRCFGVTVENLHSVKSRIAINAFDCHNMTFRNITGRVLQGGFPSHGRAFTGWQVENSTIENVNIQADDDGGSFIFFESWCRGIKLRNIVHFDKSDGSGLGPCVQIAGGSYGIVFDDLFVDSKAPRAPIATAADPGEWRVNRLYLKRYPLTVEIDRVLAFKDDENGLDFFAGESFVTGRAELDMEPSMSNVSLWLAGGIFRRTWVYAENVAEISAISLINSTGGAGDTILAHLVAGEWVKIPTSANLSGRYGSSATFNNPATPDKRILLSTTGSMPSGAKLNVVFEYWPILGGTQYTFPVR